MLGESTIRRSGLVREDREGVPEKAVLELKSGGAGVNKAEHEEHVQRPCDPVQLDYRE